MYEFCALFIIFALDAPKNDPQSFKRFAERVRIHLFNLSTIGESGHADIIERLALKLQLSDRLEWNFGRGDYKHVSVCNLPRSK
jgi:hypothetical protein